MLPPHDLFPPDEELTTHQAATTVHVNRRTIVAWIHAGNLPATRLPGKRGHYRILWKDLFSVLRRPATPREETP